MKALSVSILAAGLMLGLASPAASAQWSGDGQYRQDDYGRDNATWNGYVDDRYASDGYGSSRYDSNRYGDDRYGSNRYAQPAVDRYGHRDGAQYDFARVIRVDPVIVGASNGGTYGGRSGYAGYGDGGYGGYRNETVGARRCYTRQDGGYVSGYGGQSDGYYGDRGDRGRYGYGNDGYGNDGYGGDRYGGRDGSIGGTQAGRSLATVAGGVIGAVLGSRVGGGSARYATAALGSVLGGVAGQQIYDGSHPQGSARVGQVTVCDPETVRGDGNARVAGYDVTYEYAGRRYATRTDYNPGDTIRVRVDVRPE